MQFGTSTSSSARHRLAPQRGVALVEFALVVPLLFALLLGSITGGLALSRKNSMLNASREGSRLGATIPSTASWATSTRDRVVELAGGDLKASEVCVELVSAPSTTVQASSCSLPAADEPAVPAGAAAGDCIVKVWARRTSPFETMFFSKDVTLTASSVALYERGRGSLCST